MKSNKIKILHIIDHYKVGGPGKTIINSYKYINKKRYDIHVCTFVESPNKETEFTIEIDKLSIPRLFLADFKGVNLRQIKMLKKYIEKSKIDILHSHGYKTDFIGIILKYLLGTHVKIVTTQHGWITNNLKQTLYMKLDQFALRLFDGSIFVSKDMVDKYRIKNNRLRNMRIIHNAIVIGDYQKLERKESMRREIGIKKEDKVIGVVGRLSYEKGCNDLIDAFIQIKKMIKNVCIVFVGDGPLLDTLKKKVKRNNCENEVYFVGHQKTVQPYYEAFDMLASLSSTEGLSNVILEALVNRLPIIATDVGGNREIIDHEYSGLLVKYGQKEQYVKEIKRIICDEELGNYLGTNGFKTILKRFAFNRRMINVENIYEKIMSY
ncbi:MAG: glycosyltransferase family 4 protein [Candidatus Thorarchaeota archaeon]